MENRHGLCAGLEVTPTTGTAETEAAQTLLRRQKKEQPQTPQSVGADKNYHNAEFVTFCRKQHIAPHVATRADRKVQGLDGRTTHTKAYQTSQQIRKRVEECIGWIKDIGGLRRVKVRGQQRVGLHAWLVGCAYNLVRMGKLMEESPPVGAAA
jgi:IS5 family transposase